MFRRCGIWFSTTALVALIGVAVLPPFLSAQTTSGTITGTATDPSGLPVPGVRVTVRNEGTNISQETVTDARGDYAVSHLIPGVYSVIAKQEGFRGFTKTGIVLATASTVRADIPLEMGQVAAEVTVTGGAPLVESESSNLAGMRTNVVMERLPINVRGNWDGFFYAMLPLTPGAVAGTSSGAFSLGGTRGSQNQFTMDGTSTNSPLNGWSIGPAQSSMESVRELRIDLANNKAEYNAPGMITGTSKSGENAVHGSLFYYHDNGKFNARNTFSTTVPFAIGHDVGGSLGGPVYVPKLYNGKNRTFFFVTYETFPLRNERVASPSVPTEKMRLGDFSALLPGTVIKDPLTGQPLPGNMIPGTRLNSVSLKVQEQYYPHPNYGNPDGYVSNFRQNIPGRGFKHQRDFRIDHRISRANSLFGRISYARMGQLISDSALPTVGKRQQNRKAIPLTISDTHIINPRTINEFRYGMVWNNNPYGLPRLGADIVKELGLQGLSPTLPQHVGMPIFNITSMTAVSASETFCRDNERTHELVDNISWTRGEHTLKAGVEMWRNLGSTYPGDENNVFGNYSFTGVFSGFAYADFLLGIPQTSTRLNPAPLPVLVNRDWSLFVQDDWKVSRKLTLNLGVRYDLNQPYHETSDLMFLFDPNIGKIVVPADASLKSVNPLFPSNLIPVVTAQAAGYPASLFSRDKNNIVPRFGFAYRPFASAGFVIRGGFGMYVDTNSSSLYRSSTGGPFRSSESFTNSITGGAPRFIFPRAFPEGFGAVGAQSFSPIDPHNRNARIQQWNLTVEREVLHMGIRASYIGTQSRHLMWSQNLNQPQPGLAPFNNNMRRFPAIQNVNYLVNGGTSAYNALQAVAERKFLNGLYCQLGWTWAKNLTDISGEGESGSAPQNAYDRRADRGNVSFMAKHRVVGQLVYTLPFGPGRPFLSALRGVPRALLAGWTLSSVLTTQTGTWFTPSFSGYDVSNTNTTGGRPDRIGSGVLPAGERTIYRWFDASAFRVPGDTNGDGRPDVPVGRFGNCGVAILTGPGSFVLNAGVHKEFSLTERARMVLQFTTTNAPNHVNYSNPSSNISSTASLGRITGASAARTGQLAMRIEF